MRLIIAVSSILLLLKPVLAVADDSYMLTQLQNLKMVDEVVASSTSKGEARFLEAEAFRVGNHAGAYWASKQINEMLNSMANYLDITFNFQDSVIYYKGLIIVPPVVEELNNYTQVSGSFGKEFRVARKRYQIKSEPRFTIELPTWRNYLLLSPQKPTPPSSALLPKTRAEQEVWKAKVKEGWETGLQQSIYRVNSRFFGMTRDLVGMDLYHLLKVAKVVSEPIIDHNYEPVSGGGYDLSIDYSIVRIEVSPQLNANRYAWLSIPQLPDVNDLHPRGIFTASDLSKDQ